MANGKLRELRALVAASAILQSAEEVDVKRFIDTGELDGHSRPSEKAPIDPLTAEFIRRINANGGQFVMP